MGRITIATIAERLRERDPSLLTWPAGVVEAMVWRVLELGERARAGKSVPGFVGVDTRAGRMTVRRPGGITPVGDAIIVLPAEGGPS